jgi:hypothetical protein
MPRADYNELAQPHDDRGTPSAPLLAGLALEQRVPICVGAVMSSRKAPSSSGHECAAGDAGCTRTLHIVVVSFCAGSSTVPCHSPPRAYSSRTTELCARRRLGMSSLTRKLGIKPRCKQAGTPKRQRVESLLLAPRPPTSPKSL